MEKENVKNKIVIFDFDYTLVDASDSIVESFRYALPISSVESLSDTDIKKTIGLSLKSAFEMLVGYYDEEKYSVFYQKFLDKTKQIMLGNTVVFSGVKEVIHTLKSNGMLIAIVTNKFSEDVFDVLRRERIENLVDFVVGGDMVSAPKPSPESLISVLDKFHVKKEEAVYIGDHEVDAIAAQRAGIDYIGVLTGMSSGDQLCKYNNLGIVSKLDEIIPLI